MTITVLSEWFLLKIDKYIVWLKTLLTLSELRRLISNFLLCLRQMFAVIASISLWRLILLVLKRIISIIKTGLRYFLIELPAPTLEFLYVLHFVRAFLTLLNFFKDTDNKNLVEITKFLYACFKVFISLLMLSFLIVLIAHGLAPLGPLGLVAYTHIKNLFRIYTFSKFAMSLVALGFSYYKIKTYQGATEDAWLQAQYQANFQKHTHILVIGALITISLTLVSVFGLSLGPVGFGVVVVLASLFLLIDIAKAIYFFKNSCDVPEPKMGILSQENSLIDFSSKDYYYRKCRSARLYEIKNSEDESNRIYLLKEIVIKITQLKTKLEYSPFSRLNFFSEKKKIQEKIEVLKQQGSSLLSNDYEKNKRLFNKIIEALKKDYQDLNKNHKTLIPKCKIENFINELSESNNEASEVYQHSGATILDELLHARDRPRKEGYLFRQSFFRKIGDCEDITKACKVLRGIEKEDEQASSENNYQGSQRFS